MKSGRVRPRLGVAAAAITILLAACSGDSSPAPTAVTATMAPTTTTLDPGHIEPDGRGFILPDDAWWRASRSVAEDLSTTFVTESWASRSLDLVISRANLGVHGRITGVSGPFWNQADGQRWFADHALDYENPSLYREISLAVDSVIFDEIGHAAPDVTIEFIATGDGRGPFSAPGTQPRSGIHLATGDEVIVLLEYRAIGLREGFEDVYMAVLQDSSVFDPIGDGRFRQRDNTASTATTLGTATEWIVQQQTWTVEELVSAADLIGGMEVSSSLAKQYPENTRKTELMERVSGFVDPPECLNAPRGRCP